MKYYSTLKKGSNHDAFCEDYLITHESEEYFFASVFDGCSGGVDSHFASSLHGKLMMYSIKEFLKNKKDNEIYNLESISKKIIETFSINLNDFKNKYNLNYTVKNKEDNEVYVELLSTIIFMIYCKKNNSAFIVTIGDGVIVINDSLHSIDQQNEPNYIIYFLNQENNKCWSEKFQNWWNSLNCFFVGSVEDITISTDGIETFKNYKSENDINLNPINQLTKDKKFEKLSVMLGRKYNMLIKDGWKNLDDLGIVRIIV